MAKKKKKKQVNSKPVAKSPRQSSLPGMDDRAIRALNEAALSYDDVKKERMKLTEQEVELKEQVRELMHAQKRKHYRYKNIEISLEPEGEKVRVRVKSADDIDEENVPEDDQATAEDLEDEPGPVEEPDFEDGTVETKVLEES